MSKNTRQLTRLINDWPGDVKSEDFGPRPLTGDQVIFIDPEAGPVLAVDFLILNFYVDGKCKFSASFIQQGPGDMELCDHTVDPEGLAEKTLAIFQEDEA